MLPYETERHAKTIFSKWVSASLSNGTPTEGSTTSFAETAVRLAKVFSDVAESHLEKETAVQIRKTVTFEELIEEWQRVALIHVRPDVRRHTLSYFHRHVFPVIGARPAETITTPELISVFQKIEDAGSFSLAHRVWRETLRAYRFAIASGYALTNPAADVRASLYRWKPRHRPTILLPRRIGQLLRAIDKYDSVTTSKYMVRLLPLVFVRPGELRKAEWAEIDFKSSLWRIPARRMKARRPHLVPLSRQAKKIFREVRRVTGSGRYVFASSATKDGIISVGLCSSILLSTGFRGEITMSGFRSMAATLLSDHGWNSDAIERQLSHLDPRPVRRAYNFAEYLPERRRMMQAWADYLDSLKAKSKPSL